VSPDTLIFPGLPGHRPALKAGLRVSGVRSPNRRESPAEGFSLFAIRVNVPALCLVSLRALRALRLLRDFGEQSRPRSYFGRTLKQTIIQDLCTKVSRFLALKETTVLETVAPSCVGKNRYRVGLFAIRVNAAVALSPLSAASEGHRLAL
jgi:hypothetical protein